MNLDGYVDVAARLKMMFDRFPELRLIEEKPEVVQVGDRQFISVTVTAYREPDDPLPATATAWEPYPGRTPYTRDSEMMNAATSALGRVANLLMPIGKSLASMEEVLNRRMDGGPDPDRRPSAAPEPVWDDIPPPEDPEPVQRRVPTADRASEAQLKAVYAIAKKKNLPHPGDNLSKREASDWIEQNGDPRG
jgi:hypothetical protein